MAIDYISDEEISGLASYSDLADAIDAAFAAESQTPVRHHHQLEVPGAEPGHLLLMPCWQEGAELGIKLVTFFPGNAQRGEPTVNAGVLLFDAQSGVPKAYLDGNALTLRRTAAASLLAARYLARPDSAELLVVGTGQLAEHMARAHASEFPLKRIRVWGRDASKAAALAEKLQSTDCQLEMAAGLEIAARAADIITCATSTSQSLIEGAWLRPGQHLDLVGAFTAEMREADDEAMVRSRIYVDTRNGALAESGELIQAIANGVITERAIVAEMSELARGQRRGRQGDDEITLFKSVGCALEDLAAAQLVVARRAQASLAE